MIPAYSDIGLKEWSVIVEALGRGDQTILLRKGGIREETRQFSVAHDEFFLYPTQYHQGADMLKPDARHLLDADYDDPDDPIVSLSVFAEVVDAIALEDDASLASARCISRMDERVHGEAAAVEAATTVDRPYPAVSHAATAAGRTGDG